MKLLTRLITVHRLIQRKRSICSRFAAISGAELAQKRVEEKIKYFDFQNCKFHTKFLIAETGISKKPLGSKNTSTNRLPEAILGFYFIVEFTRNICERSKKNAKTQCRGSQHKNEGASRA
jgi:hypothetical protein